jgi:ribosomal protein S27E
VSALAGSRIPRPVRGRRVDRRIEIQCVGCGYGGVVFETPTRCPMCGSTIWARERPETNAVITERSTS